MFSGKGSIHEATEEDMVTALFSSSRRTLVTLSGRLEIREFQFASTRQIGIEVDMEKTQVGSAMLISFVTKNDDTDDLNCLGFRLFAHAYLPARKHRTTRSSCWEPRS